MFWICTDALDTRSLCDRQYRKIVFLAKPVKTLYTIEYVRDFRNDSVNHAAINNATNYTAVQGLDMRYSCTLLYTSMQSVVNTIHSLEPTTNLPIKISQVVPRKIPSTPPSLLDQHHRLLANLNLAAMHYRFLNVVIMALPFIGSVSAAYAECAPVPDYLRVCIASFVMSYANID